MPSAQAAPHLIAKGGDHARAEGMMPGHTDFLDGLKRAGLGGRPGGAGDANADAVRRITALAHLLDNAFVIPGTNRRIGLDALIGLVPGIGDAVSAALSSYIIWEARQLGLPRWKIARMIGNVAMDGVLGAVPFVGDLFDAGFKANQRNVRIVLDHLGVRAGPQIIEGSAVRVDEGPGHPLPSRPGPHPQR